MNPDTRAFIVRNHMATLFLNNLIEWHSDITDEMVAEIGPTPVSDVEADELIEQLPSSDDLVDWELVITSLGHVSPLGYEDRAYVAEVRAHLFDALLDLRVADFDAAYSHVEAAYRRMRFVVFERKRASAHPRSNVYLNPVARSTLSRLTEDIELMLYAVANLRTLAVA